MCCSVALLIKMFLVKMKETLSSYETLTFYKTWPSFSLFKLKAKGHMLRTSKPTETDLPFLVVAYSKKTKKTTWVTEVEAKISAIKSFSCVASWSAVIYNLCMPHLLLFTLWLEQIWLLIYGSSFAITRAQETWGRRCDVSSLWRNEKREEHRQLQSQKKPEGQHVSPELRNRVKSWPASKDGDELRA